MIPFLMGVLIIVVVLIGIGIPLDRVASSTTKSAHPKRTRSLDAWTAYMIGEDLFQEEESPSRAAVEDDAAIVRTDCMINDPQLPYPTLPIRVNKTSSSKNLSGSRENQRSSLNLPTI